MTFSFEASDANLNLQAIKPLAMAEEMRLAAEVSPGKLTLEKTNRASGIAQYLELHPIGGRFDLSIVNLEPESVLGSPRPGVPPELVREFAWFYGLYDNVNAAEVGTTKPLPKSVKDLKDGNPYCPQTQSTFP